MATSALRLALAPILLAILFAGIRFAHAESVQWSQIYVADLRDRASSSDTCWYQNVNQNYMDFPNPGVTISYYTETIDADTGAVIPCGGTVPVGTNIQFRFIPHDYMHISWFTAGGNFDTPYGEWHVGAAKPVANMCSYLPANDLIRTKQTKQLGSNITGDVYATLSVNPPAKTLDIAGGALECSGSATDMTRSCLASSEGSAVGIFTFDPTIGQFYGRTKIVSGGLCVSTGQCKTSNAPMRQLIQQGGSRSFPTFSVDVPQQTISCPITVINAEGEAPSAPTLAAWGNASCVVGEPHTIIMSASDPDGDALRYAMDWDANGTIDQFVPASGYVPSGTTLTASRTYAVAGAKTVRVLAQDERGLTSPWSALSFQCAESATAALNEGGSGTGGSGLPLTTTDLTLRVIPSLVRSGGTTKVNWSATGVSSCTVSAPNGDLWDTLLSSPGGETSRPIVGQTTYTLSCIDSSGVVLTKTATVRIVPAWRER